MKTIRTLLFTLFFFTYSLHAQIDFEWARQISGISAEEPHAMVTDPNGNSIVAGIYTSPFLTIGNTTLENANDNETFFDIYLAKYDSDGNVLWARTGGGEGHEGVKDVAIDEQGNIFLTGYYSEAAVFEDQILDNEFEMFLAKYNSEGDLLWIKESESISSLSFSAPNSIVVDAGGNIYLGGPSLGNEDAIIFGETYVGDSDMDGFLMKLDTEGNVLWFKVYSALDPDNVVSGIHLTVFELAINPTGDQISVSGLFGGEVDFGGESIVNSTYGTPGIVNEDIFVATYNSGGDLLWVKNIGGLGEIGSELGDPNSLGIDANNNVYLTGVLAGLMVFSNGDTIQTEGFDLMNFETGADEMFVVKYNSGGDIQWIEKVAANDDATKNVQPNGLKVDPSGNCYITGSYNWAPLFGPFEVPLVTQGTFITKINTNGNFEWVVAGGSFGQNQGIDIGIDNEGNAYATGRHQFAPTFGDFELGDGGLLGTFVVKVGSDISAISKVRANNSILISPNPSSVSLVLESESGFLEKTQVNVLNTLGKVMLTKSISGNNVSLDISELANGAYYLQVQSVDTWVVRKFIKQGDN